MRKNNTHQSQVKVSMDYRVKPGNDEAGAVMTKVGR